MLIKKIFFVFMIAIPFYSCFNFSTVMAMEELDNCGICLESGEQNNIVIMNCNHQFHKHCIDQWISRCRNGQGQYNRREMLNNIPTCPMCRSEINQAAPYRVRQVIPSAPLVQDQAQNQAKDNCVICTDQLEGSDLKLKCGHQFHQNCIDQWKRTCPNRAFCRETGRLEASCPVCRAPVIADTSSTTTSQNTTSNRTGQNTYRTQSSNNLGSSTSGTTRNNPNNDNNFAYQFSFRDTDWDYPRNQQDRDSSSNRTTNNRARNNDFAFQFSFTDRDWDSEHEEDFSYIDRDSDNYNSFTQTNTPNSNNTSFTNLTNTKKVDIKKLTQHLKYGIGFIITGIILYKFIKKSLDHKKQPSSN